MLRPLLRPDGLLPNGRDVRFSLPRRFISDLLYFAQRVPSVPVQRVMNVAALREARSAMTPHPSWCVLFTKAYAIVASRIPELRRAYLACPTSRVYEHPYSIASIAVERPYQGENIVFFTRQHAPEDQLLGTLQTHLRLAQRTPVDEFEMFQFVMLVTKLPRPIRRLLWWISLNCFGGRRARRMGTFGVSVYSALGVESLHPLSPVTTTLNYGPIQPDGTVTVRIVYDHRIMDGATVGRALVMLEKVLHDEILHELTAARTPALTL